MTNDYFAMRQYQVQKWKQICHCENRTQTIHNDEIDILFSAKEVVELHCNVKL